MVTGGELENKDSTRKLFILDVNKETIVELPELNSRRNGHAMTWIDGNPAVIGGDCKLKLLNSVEMFKNKAWVETSSIYIPRHGLSAVRNHEAVWIAGGSNLNRNFLVTIEMYNDFQWKLLQIKLFRPVCSPGLICIENSLYSFGGRHSKEYFSDAYWISSRIKLKNLENKFCNGSNQHCISPSEVSIIGKVNDFE